MKIVEAFGLDGDELFVVTDVEIPMGPWRERERNHFAAIQVAGVSFPIKRTELVLKKGIDYLTFVLAAASVKTSAALAPGKELKAIE